jgi:hypothetical protein
MIAKSERGVCELTMADLEEDWVVLDTLSGEFGTWRIVYREDSRAFETWLHVNQKEKAPPDIPVLPAAAGSVAEGHLGHGAADQLATGVANMRRRPAAGDHSLQVFSCGEIIAKTSTSAERKRGFHNVRRGVKELQAMQSNSVWITIDGRGVPGDLQALPSSRMLIMEQKRGVLGFTSTTHKAHIVVQGH